ncbi:hypothetical protein BGX21_009509 [Mortierella sp. AD011]|nr:hypothetical protein BGX20_005204 [Mortierella sp. AD010]KAF9402594.1 hypothetical protein BGX21_009509 [Mortierella sp. AD011]
MNDDFMGLYFPQQPTASAIPPYVPIPHSHSAIPCQPTPDSFQHNHESPLSNSTLPNDTPISGAIAAIESPNISQRQEYHAPISSNLFFHNTEIASTITSIDNVASSMDISENTESPCNGYNNGWGTSGIYAYPIAASSHCMDGVITQGANPYLPALSGQACYSQLNIQYPTSQQSLSGENQPQSHYQQQYFIHQEQPASSIYSQQLISHPQELQWSAHQAMAPNQVPIFHLNGQDAVSAIEILSPYRVIPQETANEEQPYSPIIQPILSGPSTGDLMKVNTPVQTQRAYKRKRKGDKIRQAHSLEKKQKIIEYRQANPTVLVSKLSEKFGVSRPTVYDIIKMNGRIGQHLTERPGSFRVTQNRFRILEELLACWGREQVYRGATPVYETYSAQAFEIHRMLSSLLEKPLPPCLFTAGWYSGFKDRYKQTLMDATQGSQRISWAKEANNVLQAIQNVKPRDIYTCDGTCMYLDLMSDATFLRSKAKSSARLNSSTTVTVLLCTNATGTDRRDPLFLVRQSSAVTKKSGCVGTVLDSSLDDLPASILEKWLIDFDKSLKRKVVLLMDEALSNMLSCSNVVGNLSRVTVVTVLKPLGAILPMSTRLIKDFKIHYYTLLLQDSDAMAKYSVLIREKKSIPELHLNDVTRKSASPPKVCPLMSQSTQFERIHDAWRQVPLAAITHYFGQFRDSLADISTNRTLANTCVSFESKAAEDTLVQALKYVYPDLKGTVRQYYKNLGKNMGPGHFLRMKIQEMQRSSDFQNCFVSNPCFGELSVGTKPSKGNRMELVGQFDSVSRSSSFGLYTCRNTDQGSEELLVVCPPRACTF